jgi:DNA-binding MarR family transcriptional regulator
MAANHKDEAAGKVLHDLFLEIFQLQATLSKIMDKVHEKAGLSTSQLKIIGALDQIGPATVPDLAALLGVSRQFVQTVCNDLQAKGFLEFSDNPRHKRSKLAALTEPGHIAFRNARRKENRIIEQALPEIEPSKATEAREFLKRIKKALESL